jgi:hypothetical protein
MKQSTMHFIEYGLIFTGIIIGGTWVYNQFQKANYGKPYQTI